LFYRFKGRRLSMGTDYHPRNKKIETFYCNISGNDLLGQLHESFGLPVSDDPAWKHFGREPPFRVPYKAKAAECKMWSAVLAAIPDEKFLAHIKNEPYGWGGTHSDYVEWVRNWQAFLLKCSGYTAY
jgi:hypothetical protein